MNTSQPSRGKMISTKKTTRGVMTCSSKSIIPEQLLCGNKKADKIFKARYGQGEKFSIGCQVAGGKSVAKVSEETGMSRQHIYRQVAAVKEYADSLDMIAPKSPTLVIDASTIKNTVIVLALACQSPYSGIRYFINKIYGISISDGTISNIIKEAAKRAQEFDSKVDLSNIKQMSIDEIFQCLKPILTGVDSESTYIFLMELMPDRSSESWELVLEDGKDKGLAPEVSISDGAKGLLAGVERAFPDAEKQADTFHALHALGKELSKVERKAIKHINAEYELEGKLSGKKPRNPEKLRKALDDNKPKMNESIKNYDLLNILYSWLKILLGFSGYGLIDAQALVKWVLQEMELLAVGNDGLLREIEKIRKLVPSLLSFVGRMEQQIDTIAANSGVPPDIYRLMYRQMSYLPNSQQGIEEQCQLVNLLGNKYMEVHNAIQSTLASTKKASSLVENVNGRIRVFIEAKRKIPPEFFVLLKVYLNTRKYKRNRLKERVGKSPLELLTKLPQPEFLEIIGF